MKQKIKTRKELEESRENWMIWCFACLITLVLVLFSFYYGESLQDPSRYSFDVRCDINGKGITYTEFPATEIESWEWKNRYDFKENCEVIK